MSWEIRTTRSVEPDLDKLPLDDQVAISSELLEWVAEGPPCQNRRDIAGARSYEDRLACGYLVNYFVDESVPYVAIVRVRKA